MRSERTIVLNLTLHWWTLALPIALGLVLVLWVYSAGAQGGAPPSVNDGIVDPPPDLSRPAPAFEEPPAGFVWTINGELIPLEEVGQGPSRTAGSASRISAQSTGSRRYYLTNQYYFPDESLTACAEGYHMASLWEILDPSNLTYNSAHPDAYTTDDSGQGPPAPWYGWVRTGGYNSPSSTAGIGNCINWTSNASNYYGTAVRLSRTWETPPGEIGGVWDARALVCDHNGAVWCVED